MKINISQQQKYSSIQGDFKVHHGFNHETAPYQGRAAWRCCPPDPPSDLSSRTCPHDYVHHLPGRCEKWRRTAGCFDLQACLSQAMHFQLGEEDSFLPFLQECNWARVVDGRIQQDVTWKHWFPGYNCLNALTLIKLI